MTKTINCNRCGSEITLTKWLQQAKGGVCFECVDKVYQENLKGTVYENSLQGGKSVKRLLQEALDLAEQQDSVEVAEKIRMIISYHYFYEKVPK